MAWLNVVRTFIGTILIRLAAMLLGWANDEEGSVEDTDTPDQDSSSDYEATRTQETVLFERRLNLVPDEDEPEPYVIDRTPEPEPEPSNQVFKKRSKRTVIKKIDHGSQ